MLKKISLIGTAILVVAVLAVVSASATVSLGTTTLGEGIYEKAGQVYEVKEPGHAYHFTCDWMPPPLTPVVRFG